MGQYSLTFRRGKGVLRHNNRDFVSKNVDKNRVNLDIKIETKALKDVYNEIFGKALEEYNAKQKRKDRRITNYIEHLEQSKNHEKLFHEVIIELRNKAHHPSTALAEKVLRRAEKTFRENNHNCVVFNSVIHFDEATPHLHIDFVMIKKNAKKGLAIQNSKKGALAEMGYGTGKEEYIRWVNDNKKRIIKIAHENGIEIIDAGAAGRKNKAIDDYRAMMNANEQELEKIVDIHFEEEKILGLKPTGNIIISKKAYKAINQKAKLTQKIVQEANLIREHEKVYTEKIEELEQTNNLLSNKQVELQQKYDESMRELARWMALKTWIIEKAKEKIAELQDDIVDKLEFIWPTIKDERASLQALKKAIVSQVKQEVKTTAEIDTKETDESRHISYVRPKIRFHSNIGRKTIPSRGNEIQHYHNRQERLESISKIIASKEGFNYSSFNKSTWIKKAEPILAKIEQIAIAKVAQDISNPGPNMGKPDLGDDDKPIPKTEEERVIAEIEKEMKEWEQGMRALNNGREYGER